MSSPSPPAVVSVRPEAVDGLASELTALATELRTDADLCRVAGGQVSTALEGTPGWTAGAAATAWAGLQDVLADRAAALAQTLAAAGQAYLDHDARTAGGIGGPRRLPR